MEVPYALKDIIVQLEPPTLILALLVHFWLLLEKVLKLIVQIVQLEVIAKLSEELLLLVLVKQGSTAH